MHGERIMQTAYNPVKRARERPGDGGRGNGMQTMAALRRPQIKIRGPIRPGTFPAEILRL